MIEAKSSSNAMGPCTCFMGGGLGMCCKLKSIGSLGVGWGRRGGGSYP